MTPPSLRREDSLPLEPARSSSPLTHGEDPLGLIRGGSHGSRVPPASSAPGPSTRIRWGRDPLDYSERVQLIRSESYGPTGAFADLYRGQIAENHLTVSLLAIRASRKRSTDSGIRDARPEIEKRIKRIIRVWHDLPPSPNIVAYIGYAFLDNSPYLLSNWTSSDDIRTYIDKTPGVDLVDLVRQVARALLFLHNQDPPVVHGDIADRNVVVNQQGMVMLRNFGQWQLLGEEAIRSRKLSTPQFLAPEFSEDRMFTDKTDVYAYGCLALEILTRKDVRFPHKSKALLSIAVFQGRRRLHAAFPELPKDLARILESCWQREPSERPTMYQIYLAIRYNSNASNGLAASFLSDNPLSASIYSDDGGMDPWSATSTPPPPPELPGVFTRIIADATVPPIYTESLAAVDPNFTGETSLSSLSRVLATSGLPAATIDRIINLVSSRPRVSKLEFFVALALVALAQQGKEPSIEQVASIAQQSQTLPSPTVDLTKLSSTLNNDVPQPQTNGYHTTGPYSLPSPTSPAPVYSESDPWGSSARTVFTPGSALATGTTPGGTSIMGGLPPNWWNKQKKVTVSIFPEKLGFILNRYTVYVVQPENGSPVQRRYSEFAYLWDCLVKRYPFRIIPNLPPKKIGADSGFLEQRRKGLLRFLNFVINHPIVSADGILAAFLNEPSFEAWKKHSASISLEEESTSKKIDRVEEMSIPSDLEEKMNVVRSKLPSLIENWTRICAIADRIVKRHEAAAADLSRLNLTLNALIEQNDVCWHHPSECELHSGVRQGLGHVSSRLRNQSDIVDQRVQVVSSTTLEQLKAERDLYIATRDLFSRHARLSQDRADALKRRIEQNGHKLEGVRAAQKEGWAAEADKITNAIERDQVDIAACMARRVFIRHSIWHELRVVLHNRENTLLSQAVQNFALQEVDFARVVLGNWEGLAQEVDSMPFE
ncbi:Sorting nexin mvp1 [Tulasnella sp. 403]|nr:Sorting nexin mvp1 [Tulasnella sp. 403]